MSDRETKVRALGWVLLTIVVLVMIGLAIGAIGGGAAGIGGLVIVAVIFVALLIIGGRRRRFRQRS
jgi:O-antigen/teichoic acid export membrane protein